MPHSIFISYSHDSDAHREFVRGIADRLRADGLNCQIDQYINGFPPEGWLRWMETQVEQADFVLLVCTETYLKRYRGQDSDGGRGVNFEGVVISQTLYDHYYRNTKFIPVIPEMGSLDHVPLPLKGFSTYVLPRDYTPLYRVLTDQPATPAPEIGAKIQLGAENTTSQYTPMQPAFNEAPKRAEREETKITTGMTDTMKALLIGGAVVLLVATVAGVLALSSGSDITITNSDCANITVGSSDGTSNQDCGDKDGK